MDITTNEGRISLMDHVSYRNRCALTGWEERLWQVQLNGELADFRNKSLSGSYRKFQRKVSAARHLAQRLHDAHLKCFAG